MFEIRFSEDAERHLKQFSKRHQGIILDAVEEQLTHQPAVQTRNRKLLRENPVAAWEVRVQQFRVLYNVDEEASVVYVAAIAVKEGNKFIVEGQEFQL
jgi:mRNA-degrading endonuclease RelE of RelBE toxin-antitoxin system